MCQLFTGRKQHTPSTLALSLCTQHSKAVLALELVSIKQQNLCVTDSLCSTHVTGDSSILCAPTTSLFPCFLFFGQDSPLCLLGLPCPGGWKGNVLQHYREISFLPFALNKRVPFQHLPSATDLPCSAEQWETQLPQPASLLLLCAYLT